MQIKEGVRIWGLSAEMLLGIIIVAGVYVDLGIEPVITSISDGDHMPGSLHYVGRGVDWRTRTVPADKLDTLVRTCRSKLGSSFDVVIEGNHLHTEFDPK